ARHPRTTLFPYTTLFRSGLYAFPYRPEVVLVNPTGQIVHTLAADQLAAQGIDFVHCPAWDADETGFYFLAGAYDEEWAWRQSVRSEEHTSELQSRENLVC